MTVPPLQQLPPDASDPEHLLQALREAHQLLTIAERSAGIGI
jgi:hypothetical protein